jgi:hypothetical protein
MNRMMFRRLMSGAYGAPVFAFVDGAPFDWTAVCQLIDGGFDTQLSVLGQQLSERQGFLAYLLFGRVRGDKQLLAQMLAGTAAGRFSGKVTL